MHVVARARAHAERGNARAAIALLKPLVERTRHATEARLALAEIYRELRAPDQAGRWGIAIDGWTTPFERDRLARTLALHSDPMVFLKLPGSAPQPADLDEVLDLRAAYQARDAERWQRATEARESSPAGDGQRRADALWAVAAVLVALGTIGPTLYILGRLLLGRESWAATAAGVGWSSCAIACFAFAIGSRMEDPRQSASAAIWTGLAMLGVAVGHFVLASAW